MATNNTKNNASQTLFRFVSLRNPQLTETKKQNLGFIQRPDERPSAFDSVINPGDSALLKFQAMERMAKEFNTDGYQSENVIEGGSLSEALKIGRKIAKRETISTADENTAKNLYNSSLVQNKVAQVWDNLIYQTVTQKDFYVKEALVHILKALHFGYVCDMPVTPELIKINGEDLKAKALDAKVVLPMKFFGDGYEGSSSLNSGPFQVNVSKIGEGVINGSSLSFADQLQLQNEGTRISEVFQLSLEKDSLIKLKSELEKTQKLYYTIKNKTYDSAYKEYINQNQKAIDEYNAMVEKVDEQIEKGGMTEEEIKALYLSLEKSEVAPFAFKYKNEVNFEDLQNNLSLESFKLFVDIFTKVTTGEKPEEGFDYSTIKVLEDKMLQLGSVVVSITEEVDTFPEVFEKLDEEISSTTQTLFRKAPLAEQTYASLGGVLIPVANSYSQASKAVSKSYYLQASYQPLHSRTPGSVTFYYQAESNTWGAAAVKISASTDFGLYEESFSNVDVVDGKVTLPLFLIDKFGKAIRSLNIKIYFNNGKEASVELSGIEINQPYTGILYTDEVKDETGNPSTGTATPGVFIPKHFGVKRLGIADYLKVEQSVHAYVPGEVSNIENVMASELRHKSSVARDYSEITDTTSESVESEKISDTTKADRNEMQTEVAKELDKEQSFTGSTHFGYNKGYTLDISAGYANNTAQHDSTRQAVTKSQEITERAMERVLTKINKERVQKIIKEYTETNVHEFDNRGSKDRTPQHITGVYRWVDKKMKNQIYNYGKRTMFEFMIPEPARLHTLAAFSTKQTLKAPVDPRTAPSPQTMTDAKSATKDLLAYWANVYGVKMTEIKEKDKQIETVHDEFNDDGNCVVVQRNFTVTPNYICKSVDVSFTASREKSSRRIQITGDFTNGIGFQKDIASDVFSLGGFNMSGNWVFKNSGYNIGIVDMYLTLNLEIMPSLFEAWKQENFDAIIKAYEAAYADFAAKQKEADEKAKEEEANNKESLEGINFYRDIESVILKHNCIAYLLQDYGALGKNFTNNATEMKDFSIILSDNLEQYTALAKFMEQAFEWSIMDYTFYPYYWANKDSWQKMYLSQSTDPLFRSFLQSGMARVVVTVKPGFEDAVQFFMCTGKIWNGGEVPVIGDPLYMSIVDELRQPTGEAQGKYWITRIPTTLTILQAESVGLKVDEPLPIFPEDDPDNCENPKDLETLTSFTKDDIRMESSDEKTTTLPTTIVG